MVRQSTRGGRKADPEAVAAHLEEAKRALDSQDFKGALKAAQSAIRNADPAKQPRELARACYYAAAALVDLGKHGEAAERASLGFHALGDLGGCELAMLHAVRGQLHADQRRFDEARDDFDAAERTLLGDSKPCPPLRLACIRILAAQVEILDGRSDYAIHRLNSLLTDAGADAARRADCYNWLSLAEGLAENDEQAIAWAQRLRDAADKFTGHQAKAYTFDGRLLLARWLLDLETARELVTVADREFRGEPYYRAEARIAVASILAYNKPDEALEVLEAADYFVKKSHSLWLRQSLVFVEMRATKGMFREHGGALHVEMSAESIQTYDVAKRVFERWVKRAALRICGTPSEAGRKLDLHPANVSPRRPVDASDDEGAKD